MLIMYIISSLFTGKSMATLPFDPPSFFVSMTHSGVPGDNYRQVSPAFISMMTAAAIKNLISRYNRYDGPRMPLEHHTPKWAQQYIEQ